MKQFRLFLLFLSLTAPFSHNAMAQTTDNLVSREYEIKPFSSLHIEGNYRVFLYQSDQPFLRVKANSESLFEQLKIESNRKELVLSVRKTQFNVSRIELHIGVNQLEEIKVNGGVKLTSDGYIAAKDLSALFEGGASIDLTLKANSLRLVCNGGAIIQLAGATDRLSLRISGAGYANTRELTAKYVDIRVEGLGVGSVHASETLDVKIEGVGKVTYTGNPEVSRFIEGIGTVAVFE